MADGYPSGWAVGVTPEPSRLSLRALLPPAPPLGRSGDPGVIQPHDVMWTVVRERLLLLGGPAALLLQVAHPLIAEAVATQSGYRAQPTHRLLTTLQVSLTVTFGDTRQAREAARGVGRRHARVSGTTTTPAGGSSGGTAYRATDPELALWVHATLVWTALTVYDRYVRPLRDRERNAYWQQAKPFGRLFGVSDHTLPDDWDAFAQYWSGMVAAVEIAPTARAIASDVLHPRFAPPLPGVAHLARAVTADLLPEKIRTGYGLPHRRLPQAEARVLQAIVHALHPHIHPRLAYWPHYRRAVQRVAAATPPA